MKKTERIDSLVVSLGLADTLEKARALIMAGEILADERRIEKPSEKIAAGSEIRIKSGDSRYVGRGGIKLEHALEYFHICPGEYVCLDIGSSTGGFTDCLLQKGADRVVAVDSGTNQLDWRLRKDPRVDARENTNARNLKPADFDCRFDLIVVDVSFISVKKILPALVPLVADGGRIIVLIKPQFEVRRGEVGEGGIVRDSEKHKRVIDEINHFSENLGLRAAGVTPSPISGASGNREFFAMYEVGEET
ncbi:MAG TPA: TlyA family rRNA (cytidine-2'-O)-methyltransferase [Blastocatellia bacterium]|nr:TlyA family rRNA (cytidine-2'-O)-methyltransferase [Blastocatellia bacterium]